METPFAAYSGDQPYIFVCYAHVDSDVVYPEIAWLRNQGVNMWYDEGISAGKNWRTVIGDSLLRASHVLFYVSAGSLESDHCNREISLALDEGKQVVPVYIEDVELTTDLKVGLTRIHALRRDQDANYQQHLVDALSKSTTPHATHNPGNKPLALRVAVMPLTTPENDCTLDDLADLLVEEMYLTMAEAPARTVSRTSTLVYKGKQVDIRQVGRDLGTRYLITGNIRRIAGDLRIILQLNEADEGVEIWSKSYRVPVADLEHRANVLAREFLTALNEPITSFEINRNKGERVENLDAATLYFKAISIPITDRESRDEVLSLTRRALALDPSNAHYHGWLAGILSNLVVMQNVPNNDIERCTQEALSHAYRAIELSPNNLVVLAFAAGTWGVCGDAETGLRYARRAYELDADQGKPWSKAVLVQGLIRCGRYDEALEHMPVDSVGLELLVFKGRYQDALNLIDRHLVKVPMDYGFLAARANTLALLDRKREAEETLYLLKTQQPSWTLERYEEGWCKNSRQTKLGEAMAAGLKTLEDSKKRPQKKVL